MTKHKWLTWASELQAIAQNGLTYSKDDFDQQRFKRILELASEIIAEHTNLDSSHITELFALEAGYMTPKLDVAYFSLDNLPELSKPRVTDKQIKMMYKHYLQPDLPTEFD